MAYLLLFAIGAVLGTALDHLHVAAAVLAYRSPVLFSQAAWVPPLFGFAAVAFVRLRRPFRSPPEERPSFQRVFLSLGGFAVAYAVTALGSARPWAVAAILVATWGLLVAGPGWRRRALYGLALASIGTTFESALSWLGGFHYLVPTTLLVPVWLPALYLHASVLMEALDRVLLEPRAEGVAKLSRPSASTPC
ncbi:MAG TPA: hypothetical protein VN883_09705 [Myxococcales bacterium]|jgi:hypothetical protein|nr:hypothetical protein [Myxococcales bacterium]